MARLDGRIGGRVRRSALAMTALGLAALIGPMAASAENLPREVSVAPGIAAQRAPGGSKGTVTDGDPGVSRIIGGSPASIADYPWQAAIDISPTLRPTLSAYDRQFCAGTLVAPKVIVSAAHCFYDPDLGVFTPPGFYTAITGRTVLSSSEGQETPFETYFYFTDPATGQPLYNPSTSRLRRRLDHALGAVAVAPGEDRRSRRRVQLGSR